MYPTFLEQPVVSCRPQKTLVEMLRNNHENPYLTSVSPQSLQVLENKVKKTLPVMLLLQLFII